MNQSALRTNEQMRWLLQGFLCGFHSQGAAARKLGISRTHLNNVLAGRDSAGKRVREFFDVQHPFTQEGAPCSCGHRERYVTSGRCAVCMRKLSRAYQARLRAE